MSAYEKDKQSFFERLTGKINVEEEEGQIRAADDENDDPDMSDHQEATDTDDVFIKGPRRAILEKPARAAALAFEQDVKTFDDDEKAVYKTSATETTAENDNEEGELAVDVYEDGNNIYIQSMIAGVEPEDIDVAITREMVTLRGKRMNPADIPDDDYYHQELYWGGFSRKVVLPEEIDPDRSEAIEKHGLLVLKLPKLNKKRTQKLEIRSIE